MPRTRKSNQIANRVWEGRHRFEHWYRDNQVYFVSGAPTASFLVAGGCDNVWHDQSIQISAGVGAVAGACGGAGTQRVVGASVLHAARLLGVVHVRLAAEAA